MDEVFLLSEVQFNRIRRYFLLSHGVPRVDDLRVVSGIIYVIKQIYKVENMFAKLKDWRRYTLDTTAVPTPSSLPYSSPLPSSSGSDH